MIGLFGNIIINQTNNSLLVNTDGEWRSISIATGRYESVRQLLATLGAELADYNVNVELLADLSKSCGLLVRICRAGELSLDFRVSGLGAVLGYPTAMLTGSQSYKAPESPYFSLACEAPAYDSGIERRQTSAALRSNAGSINLQRLSVRGQRLLKLAALDRARVNALSLIVKNAAQDAQYGLYCCHDNILKTDMTILHGERKLVPAQGQVLSFTRSFNDTAMDLWDCEICAVSREIP